MAKRRGDSGSLNPADGSPASGGSAPSDKILPAYADDILILVKADDEHVLAGLMQHALGIVQASCESVRLLVNPDKVNMILFTTRYKAKPIRGVQMGGKPLNLVNETKYLRVT